jgi:hypothetical protein
VCTIRFLDALHYWAPGVTQLPDVCMDTVDRSPRVSGFEPLTPERIDPKVTPPRRMTSAKARPMDTRCAVARRLLRLELPDAALLASLLPTVVHVRGAERLSIPYGSSARNRANRDQAATSCSLAMWRSVAETAFPITLAADTLQDRAAAS